MASIDQFKSLVSQGAGFAKPNLFRVFLPSLGGDNKELSLLCKAAELPGRQITSVDHQIGTPLRKIANGYAVTDISLTFHVLNNHSVKSYFETWQSLAHSNSTYEVNYYYNYVKPVVIQQIQRGQVVPLLRKQLGFTDKIPGFILNRLPDIGPLDTSTGRISLGIEFDETPVYTCFLLEAYPTTMNAIQLGDTIENQTMELTVQLSYKDWVSGVREPNDNLAASIAGFGINKIRNFF